MNVFNFNEVKRILVLGAHPDDEIIGPGGTIHRFSRKGKQVYVITFTCGGTATNTPEKIELMIEKRRREMEKTNRIFGITKRTILNYQSQEVYRAAYGTDELHHRLIKLIRKYKPELIFTHSRDNHCDHNAVYTITPEAVFQASESILGYLGEPWPIAPIFYYGVEQELAEPNVIVQVNKEDLGAKIEALEAQLSQTRKDYLKHFKQMVTARSQLWGAKFFGADKLAEPFYVNYRSPILVEE